MVINWSIKGSTADKCPVGVLEELPLEMRLPVIGCLSLSSASVWSAAQRRRTVAVSAVVVFDMWLRGFRRQVTAVQSPGQTQFLRLCHFASFGTLSQYVWMSQSCCVRDVTVWGCFWCVWGGGLQGKLDCPGQSLEPESVSWRKISCCKH